MLVRLVVMKLLGFMLAVARRWMTRYMLAYGDYIRLGSNCVYKLVSIETVGCFQAMDDKVHGDYMTRK